MPAAAALHESFSGGGAAASPTASAADWFEGESFDQTDGFGDERGDLPRNVRPKTDAGACCTMRQPLLLPRPTLPLQMLAGALQPSAATTATSRSSCCCWSNKSSDHPTRLSQHKQTDFLFWMQVFHLQSLQSLMPIFAPPPPPPPPSPPPSPPPCARSSDSDDANDAAHFDTANTIYCLHVTTPHPAHASPPSPPPHHHHHHHSLTLCWQSYIRKQKVQKSKTKFKVALKDGIMSLNGVECCAPLRTPATAPKTCFAPCNAPRASGTCSSKWTARCCFEAAPCGRHPSLQLASAKSATRYQRRALPYFA
jgi:hypothetical protein